MSLSLRQAAALAEVAPSTLLAAVRRGDGPEGEVTTRAGRSCYFFEPAAVLTWKAARNRTVPLPRQHAKPTE